MKKNRKERKKSLTPVKNNKSLEVSYRRDLLLLSRELASAVERDVVSALKMYESDYVSDGYARTLEEVFERLRLSYSTAGIAASRIASNFVSKGNSTNKRSFYKTIENSIGVDLSSVVQNENLTDVLEAVTRENVALIKSIPEEYFKKIESVVFRNTVRGSTANSIIKEIQNINKVTYNRAKLIARDQTSKLNSVLNEKRQSSLGVEEYIWRTSGDERVRDSHKSKNGKIFRWDSPPKDTGHPGQDIQCRCVAQPIIKL